MEKLTIYPVIKGIHKIVETEYMVEVNDINLTCCSILSTYQILHIGDVVPHNGFFVVGWGAPLISYWEIGILFANHLYVRVKGKRCFHATWGSMLELLPVEGWIALELYAWWNDWNLRFIDMQLLIILYLVISKHIWGSKQTRLNMLFYLPTLIFGWHPICYN